MVQKLNHEENQPIFRNLGIALLLLLVVMGMVFTGNIKSAGPYILLFFTTLALGFSGYKSLNGLVFTTMIFAGVSAALYYPNLFTYIGDFKLTILIIPLIQIIMFGMGTQMGLKDFAAVINNPRGRAVGVFNGREFKHFMKTIRFQTFL